tara:strand:+ start:865 stop:1158 length:294 start_codon:yes stop_codon:yes gene_type:complete
MSSRCRLNHTELAILQRLSEGPATYQQLADAAGITSDGAGKACRRRLLVGRPLLATYYHVDQGGGRDVLCITPSGQKALGSYEIVERRGGHSRRGYP